MATTAKRLERRGATEKVSISLSRTDLAVLRRRAKKRHEGNLSAAVAECAQLLREQDGRERLLEWIGEAGKTSPEEERALVEEMFGERPPAPVPRPRPRRRVA